MLLTVRQILTHCSLRQGQYLLLFCLRRAGEAWCCCLVRPSETQYVLLEARQVRLIESQTVVLFRKHFTKNLVLLDGETWRDSICDLAGVVSR